MNGKAFEENMGMIMRGELPPPNITLPSRESMISTNLNPKFKVGDRVHHADEIAHRGTVEEVNLLANPFEEDEGLQYWVEYSVRWDAGDISEEYVGRADESELASSRSSAPPRRERNQCDGCAAGIPRDENGSHRMGDGKYANLMTCQAHRYGAPEVLLKTPLSVAHCHSAQLWDAENRYVGSIRVLNSHPMSAVDREIAAELARRANNFEAVLRELKWLALACEIHGHFSRDLPRIQKVLADADKAAPIKES